MEPAFGGRTTENYLRSLRPFALGAVQRLDEGRLDVEKYLEVYARYLEKFLQGYAQAGVPVHALSTQNEIVTTQYGRMPACRWSPEFKAVFIRDHLGPLLQARHQQVQIWLLDHNYDYYKGLSGSSQDKQLAQICGWCGLARLTRVHPIK